MGRREPFILACLALWAGSIHGGFRGEWKVPSRFESMANPVASDPISLDRGERAYAAECASCHGEDGRGKGKAARELEKPVPDLLLPQILAQGDGALYWKTTAGRKPMPGFRDLLEDDLRWDVVNHIRKLTSSHPPVVPRFEAPEEHRAGLSAALDGYLVVSQALASSDLAGTTAALPGLRERVEALTRLGAEGLPPDAQEPWKASLETLDTAVKGLALASDFAHRRDSFVSVSEAFFQACSCIGHAQKTGLYVYRGSEALAGRPTTWLQLEGTPVDPYQGTSAGVFHCALRPTPPSR